MPRRYDSSRWTRLKDGSLMRTTFLPGIEEDGQPAEPVVENVTEVNATDAAFKLALERGVDLETVTGSGLHGKITKADVEAALA